MRKVMHDRRFEPRFQMEEQVELLWSDSSGAGRRCTGYVRDYSRSGASIETDRPVPVATRVEIRIKDQQVSAAVKSCRRSPGGLVLGLEFEPGSEGSLRAPRVSG